MVGGHIRLLSPSSSSPTIILITIILTFGMRRASDMTPTNQPSLIADDVGDDDGNEDDGNDDDGDNNLIWPPTILT